MRTLARNSASIRCKESNTVTLSDINSEAEWQRIRKEESSAMKFRTSSTVPSTKARGPLSKSIKYAFWAFDPCSRRNFCWHLGFAIL